MYLFLLLRLLEMQMQNFSAHKSKLVICTMTHNPLNVEWDLKESSSVSANGRNESPTEPEKRKRKKEYLDKPTK